jgi:hypothetical protein
MQNAIKLENISNLITSPSSYQCRKTTDSTVNMKVVHFVMHGRHTVCVRTGDHKGKFSKQMKKQIYLVTIFEYIITHTIGV